MVVRQCLKAIHFGMANCLLQFGDKYFEYDSEKDILNKGLTIGGDESAWLADLVAAYVLEKNKHLFLGMVFYGIYRDDGLVIFLGILSKAEIALWRDNFQG
jgi:hypothetical protein